VGDVLTGMLKNIKDDRKVLEDRRLDFSTVDSVVDNVSLLQRAKQNSKKWAADIEQQRVVDKQLLRQRFAFPEDWTTVDRVHTEYKTFDQLLSRKLAELGKEMDGIKRLLAQEDDNLTVRIKQFVDEWKVNRPVEVRLLSYLMCCHRSFGHFPPCDFSSLIVRFLPLSQGSLEHSVVRNRLGLYADKLQTLETQLRRLNEAKVAMELPPKEDTRLVPVGEELRDLKEVWDQLGKCWSGLDVLR